MLTIKEFASICGCNTQTLRYYDKVHLLKPARVDESTGYRYYEASQAFDYIKIKNFQFAEFSIEEIRDVMALKEEEIHLAFERKIEQQRERLARIIEIQTMYFKEKTMMEKLVDATTKLLFQDVRPEEDLEWFGLGAEDMPNLIQMIREYFVEHFPGPGDARENGRKEMCMVIGDEVFRGDRVLEQLETLDSGELPERLLFGDEEILHRKEFSMEGKEAVWEASGFETFGDILYDIPDPDAKSGYTFFFRLKDADRQALPFGMLVLSAYMLKRNPSHPILLDCEVASSEDGINHFALLKDAQQRRV